MRAPNHVQVGTYAPESLESCGVDIDASHIGGRNKVADAAEVRPDVTADLED